MAKGRCSEEDVTVTVPDSVVDMSSTRGGGKPVYTRGIKPSRACYSAHEAQGQTARANISHRSVSRVTLETIQEEIGGVARF